MTNSQAKKLRCTQVIQKLLSHILIFITDYLILFSQTKLVLPPQCKQVSVCLSQGSLLVLLVLPAPGNFALVAFCFQLDCKKLGCYILLYNCPPTRSLSGLGLKQVFTAWKIAYCQFHQQEFRLGEKQDKHPLYGQLTGLNPSHLRAMLSDELELHHQLLKTDKACSI